MRKTASIAAVLGMAVLPLLRVAFTTTTKAVQNKEYHDAAVVDLTFTDFVLSSGQATRRNATTSTSYSYDKNDGDHGEDEESFSACLLVMDDNHRLPEWIAYHYFSLQLRYLIVTSDPRSKTSPSRIFDKWRDRMTIVELQDADFANRNLTVGINDTEDQRRFKHSQRQAQFYGACIRQLQQQNRTWTAFVDVDEFLTISGAKNVYRGHSMSEPASVLRVVQEFSNANNSNSTYPVEWYTHFQNGPCVTFGRALYGAVESTPDEVQQNVPSFIDANRFDTLRWRYRAYPTDQNNGLGKSIVDVSRLDPSDNQGGKNAHRPANACPTAWIAFDTMPLGCNHYLGSWDSYMFRQDARTAYKGKTRAKVWRKTSGKKLGGPSDIIRPWMSGFVAHVGEDDAKVLLDGAGLS